MRTAHNLAVGIATRNDRPGVHSGQRMGRVITKILVLVAHTHTRTSFAHENPVACVWEASEEGAPLHGRAVRCTMRRPCHCSGEELGAGW